MPIHEIALQNAILATAIDTDGSIFICSHSHGKKQSPSIGHYVTFTNKSLEWLNYLKGFNVNGKINPHGRKGMYILVVESKISILELLKRVYPYLYIKKKQAELMIFYLLGRNSGKSYSQEDYFMMEEMKSLNRGAR